MWVQRGSEPTEVHSLRVIVMSPWCSVNGHLSWLDWDCELVASEVHTPLSQRNPRQWNACDAIHSLSSEPSRRSYHPACKTRRHARFTRTAYFAPVCYTCSDKDKLRLSRQHQRIAARRVRALALLPALIPKPQTPRILRLTARFNPSSTLCGNPAVIYTLTCTSALGSPTSSAMISSAIWISFILAPAALTSTLPTNCADGASFGGGGMSRPGACRQTDRPT